MNISSAIRPTGHTLLWISLLAFGGAGYSDDQIAKSSSTEPSKGEELTKTSSETPGFIPSPDTKLIAVIDKNGDVTLLGPDLKEMNSCRVCTPELEAELLSEKKLETSCATASEDQLHKLGICGRFDQYGPPFGVAAYNISVLELPGSECWFSWHQGNTIYYYPPGCTP